MRVQVSPRQHFIKFGNQKIILYIYITQILINKNKNEKRNFRFDRSRYFGCLLKQH
jgi:hypothetical protein